MNDDDVKAITTRLDRIEYALLELAKALAEDEEQRPTFDLDGNANRPARDPYEEL